MPESPTHAIRAAVRKIFISVFEFECYGFVGQARGQLHCHFAVGHGVFHALAGGEQGHLAFGQIAFPRDGGGQILAFGKGVDGIEGAAVLGGGEPGGSAVVDGCDAGGVDGFAVALEPVAELVEAFYGGILDLDVGGGAYDEG